MDKTFFFTFLEETPWVCYVNANKISDAVDKIKSAGFIDGDLPKFTVDTLDCVKMVGETSVEPIDIFTATDENYNKDLIFPVNSINDIYEIISEYPNIISIDIFTEKARYIM